MIRIIDIQVAIPCRNSIPCRLAASRRANYPSEMLAVLTAPCESANSRTCRSLAAYELGAARARIRKNLEA